MKDNTLTSRHGYSSKSSNLHTFPVSGSGSSKSGALAPNSTPPDSILAARTTTRLGVCALALRCR